MESVIIVSTLAWKAFEFVSTGAKKV
jgi:hypothetical protein